MLLTGKRQEVARVVINRVKVRIFHIDTTKVTGRSGEGPREDMIEFLSKVIYESFIGFVRRSPGHQQAVRALLS
jgi:hypothetical protein